jgi:Coenzyme PQQ synthesis protein D (PqqD)
MSYPPDEKLQIDADAVVWRDVGDEVVVLELSTSTYLTLNGTAKQIWDSLASGATLAALADGLVDRYGITLEQAQVDAESFVSALADRGLLVNDG